MEWRRTVITGGGIGGLSVALNLIEAGWCRPEELTLFEAGAAAARLHTFTARNGARCEIGAGRYHTALHPGVHSLLQRFGIEARPYRFDMRHGAAEGELTALGEIDLNSVGVSGSFYTALRGNVGTAAADRVCTLAGYEALRDLRFPAIGGTELIKTHPETFGSERYRDGWARPVNGFSALTRALRDQLALLGVSVEQPARVVAVDQGRDGLRLDVLDHRRRRRSVECDDLILMMPPNEVTALGFTGVPVNLDWLRYLVVVPLFKGFLTYEDAWWDAHDLQQVCLVTDTRLQKLYFDSADRTVSFYCDSWNADYWNSLRASGHRSFRAALLAEIQEAVGRPLPQLESADELICHYWPTGICYVNHHCAAAPADGYVWLTDHIVLGSDAFTGNPGWIEGALRGAAQISGLFAAPAANRH